MTAKSTMAKSVILDRYGKPVNYEAAKTTRFRRKRIRQPNKNLVVQTEGPQLTVIARQLEEDYDIVKGILDCLVNKTVGAGIRSVPQLRDQNGDLHIEANAMILDRWEQFIRFPEVTGTFSHYEAQRMMCRGWLRDGDSFAQLLIGRVPKYRHLTDVQLSYEMIESDDIPMQFTDEPKRIYSGIQVDAWFRPRVYYATKDTAILRSFASMAESDLKKIFADKMIHIRKSLRVKQIRGVTALHSIINRMEDIKDYDDSERIAARIAADNAFFVRKGTPDLYSDDGEERDDFLMEAGMVYTGLNPGEEIGNMDTKRPNPQLLPFRNGQLRAAAAGAEVGYSTISRDYNGTYSAQRQELVEQSVGYDVMHMIFCRNFCDKIHKAFMDVEILTGGFQLPPDVDETTLYDVQYSRPPIAWPDPSKEGKAFESFDALQVKSRTQIIQQLGGDPVQVRKQRLQEKLDDLEDRAKLMERAAELGITLSMEEGGEPPAEEGLDPDEEGLDPDENQGDDPDDDEANS